MSKIRTWLPLYDEAHRLVDQDCLIRNKFIVSYNLKKNGTKDTHDYGDFVHGVTKNSYYITRLLHFIGNMLKASEHIVNPYDKHYTGKVNIPTAIPFELDAFLMASSTIIDKPFKERLQPFFDDKTELDAYHALFPQRSEPSSLFWRIKILRNSILHATHQQQYGNNVHIEFSSNFGSIEYNKGEIVHMVTTLLDPKGDERWFSCIERCITSPYKNVVGEFFLQCKREMEKNKNNKNSDKVSWKGLDLVDGFPDVCFEMIQFIDQYHHFIARWFEKEINIGQPNEEWLMANARRATLGQTFPHLYTTPSLDSV